MDMLQEELRLEEEACATAREHLEKLVNDALAEGNADRTLVGKRIIRYNFAAVREAIGAKIEEQIAPKKGATADYVPFLQNIVAAWIDAEHDIEELYDIITLGTLSIAIASALDTTGKMSVSMSGLALTRQILDEVHIVRIGEASGKLNALENGVKKRVDLTHKQIYIRNILKNHQEMKLDAVQSIKTKLGIAMIDTALEAGMSDFCVMHSENKSITKLVPTPLLERIYNKNMDKLLSLAHQFVPMVVKPHDWTAPTGGAYVGRLQGHANLIRLQDCTESYVKTYQERLQTLDMSQVYEAVNAYQSTAYHINQRVYDVLSVIIEELGGDMAGIPRMTPLDEIPAIPVDADKDTIHQYKRRCVDRIHREIARKTKSIRFLTTLAAAKKYKDYPEIYFPVNMDWRGRLYPMPTAITPQGDDMQKSLLEFAHPAEIKTDEQGVEALRWLKIHAANCAGYDKLTYDERLAWVNEHLSEICEVAKAPLDNKDAWIDADEPCCYLAACFALFDAIEYQKIHGNLKGFACSLPVALDATCSVLQHFSAILRDKTLGKLVNLTDTGKVEDIYGEIAKYATVKLLDDAKNGTADTQEERDDGTKYTKSGTKKLAKMWVEYNRRTNGKDDISRKVAKKCVMTYGYGSELYGFKCHVYEQILKPYLDKEGIDNSVFGGLEKAASMYMGKIIWKVVCEQMSVVEATKNYIKEAVKVAADNGMTVISWTTDDGLLVQSNYHKVVGKTLKMRVSGKLIRLYSQDTTEEPDDRKQVQAISPNFIHSRDAAHMRAVLRACTDEGMTNYMMIHDSFAVEIANAAKLYEILHATFIAMYDNANVLQDFVDGLKKMTPKAEYAKAPEFGGLDIKAIVAAEYAFC